MRAGGSSMLFSSVLPTTGSIRSASRSTTTLRSPSIGDLWISGITRGRSASRRADSPERGARISFGSVYVAVVGSNSTTSGCVPRATSPAERSSVAPITAAANARAASITPEPRPPTRRYACDGCSAAARSVATARSWPTTSSHIRRRSYEPAVPASSGATAVRTAAATSPALPFASTTTHARPDARSR